MKDLVFYFLGRCESDESSRRRNIWKERKESKGKKKEIFSIVCARRRWLRKEKGPCCDLKMFLSSADTQVWETCINTSHACLHLCFRGLISSWMKPTSENQTSPHVETFGNNCFPINPNSVLSCLLNQGIWAPYHSFSPWERHKL